MILVPHRWLGIDFSGDHSKWGQQCTTGNIWIATVDDSSGSGLVLHDLIQVQQLPGVASPFSRLAELLSSRQFRAAAIDAPFSIPREYLSGWDYEGLLKTVAEMPCHNRPFPTGNDFIVAATGKEPPLEPCKPYRATERIWKERKVNVRSTLWNGARGGAPMTAACLKLLGTAKCPIWPWASPEENGLIVEAFPAAQLQEWGISPQKYNGNSADATAKRRFIIDTCLANRISLPEASLKVILGSADALDAILCAFAAVAVTEGALEIEPGYPEADFEGWISVHVA